MTHDEDVIGKAYDARLMRRLLTYLYPYRPQVALAALAIALHSLLELLPPYLIKLVIDSYIPAGDLSGLGIVAAVFLPLGLLTGLLGINVGGMPGVDSGLAFWSVTALLIVLGGVELWLLKRLKWV